MCYIHYDYFIHNELFLILTGRIHELINKIYQHDLYDILTIGILRSYDICRHPIVHIYYVVDNESVSEPQGLMELGQ